MTAEKLTPAERLLASVRYRERFASGVDETDEVRHDYALNAALDAVFGPRTARGGGAQ